MLKKCVVLSLLLLIFMSTTVWANEAEEEARAQAESETLVNELLDKITLDNVERVTDRMSKETRELLPQKSFTQLVKDFVFGNLDFNWKNFFGELGKFFFHEVWANSKLLGQLLVLVVLACLFRMFHEAFGSNNIARLSNGVIYLSLMYIAIHSFISASQIGTTAIERSVNFMHALLPTLFTLLISMGGVGSATIFQPLVLLIVSLISTVIKTVVLPLVGLAVAVSIVSNFTDQFKLSLLGGLIKKVGITILSVSLIMFLGVGLIQGLAATVADGISLRTAKYLTGAFVPILGGLFANALELVVGCSLLIYNGVGLLGMLFVLIIIVLPLFKILSLVFIYKLVSAIIQPVSEPIIVESLDSLGNALMLIFLSVTTVAIMFFITVTILVGMGNMSVMLR